MPARERHDAGSGTRRLLQSTSTVAALVSGMADGLDLPKKLDQLPAVAELANTLASPMVWIPAAALAAASLTLKRRVAIVDTQADRWQAPDQAKARAANPGYAAMISYQPTIMDFSSSEIVAGTGLDGGTIDGILRNPTCVPTQDIVQKLEDVFLLPRGACGPKGVILTGRFTNEREMIWRLKRLGDRRLVAMLASDGTDLLHDVAAFQVQRDRLHEVYAIALSKRYRDVRIDAKGAII